MKMQKQMFQELIEKRIFEQARAYAYSYIDGVQEMEVFPSPQNLENLKVFDEKLSTEPLTAERVLGQLHQMGSSATIAQTGGRYFGFVDGGAVPVSLAVKWLSDVWDQNGGLYLTSPLNAKLESVCENWLKDIFKLPSESVAGFVSGTSVANLCGLIAARYRLLKNLGWDVNIKGLNGAPRIRIIAHEQVHASIQKTFAILGFGQDDVTWVPSDDQGRMIIEELPELDSSCLVILQAGNANTGSFDKFSAVCDKANRVGAWVHVDGAFGLWAGASKTLSHLTAGMEKASSWAVDGHKTLNTPYDSGIVLCRDEKAFVTALQATGEYIIYSDERDPMLYTPEMSKRSRAIELWATMKYLGKNGIDEMVTGFYQRAKQLEKGLLKSGFRIINEVVFNQVLVACETDEITKGVLDMVQKSGEVWCGGSKWQGEAAIRISICSWATTENDIERTIAVFKRAKNKF